MLVEYFKKKSKFGLAINIAILVLIILLIIPATRKDTGAFILKSTIFIHQPKINTEKPALKPESYMWQLVDITGEHVTLGYFYGKVIVVNLWATWCPPCIAELPALQKLYKHYGNDVEFLFISNEDPNTVKTFLNKKGYTIPTFTPITEYPSDFETRSIPATFIINKKGEIVIHQRGVAQWNTKKMRNLIDSLIVENTN